MAFKDFPNQHRGIELLQRSLARRRVAHAYLFAGDELSELEALARTLAKTINCLHPLEREGAPIDCCDQCLTCRKIEHGNHADAHWVRPESKTRIIKVEEMRELMKEIQLKPSESAYKVAVVVAADRLRAEGANAFLKTLEEPPLNSILILLTTEPQRLLETILSRCLRLNFGGGAGRSLSPQDAQWLASFSELAAAEQKSLLGRYRLMDVLLARLTAMKSSIEESVSGRSPLEQYKDAEKEQVDRWEAELNAAIEAEYRHQRAGLLKLLHCWLRDVWLMTLGQKAGSDQTSKELLSFPELAGTGRIASRIASIEATRNLEVLDELQRRLYTNVQEALALEVGLLKLRL